MEELNPELYGQLYTQSNGKLAKYIHENVIGGKCSFTNIFQVKYVGKGTSKRISPNKKIFGKSRRFYLTV